MVQFVLLTLLVFSAALPRQVLSISTDEAVAQCGDLADLYGVTDAGELADPISNNDWHDLGCNSKVC